MKNILYLLVVLFFFCSSCGDFLEEYSQNSTYVESVDDLDELLLGGGYLTRNVGSISATGAMAYLHIMADESKEMPVPNSSVSKRDQEWEKMAGFYIWAENPFTSYTGVARSDGEWASFYTRISVLNSILEEAPNCKIKKDAEREQLSRVLGECYYLRAWNYFMLANIYGAAYDKSNLNDGASVTLKLDPAIEDKKFARASTGEVYQQIVRDLTQAATLLEQGSVLESKVHVTAAAAYALLSRVYLYMEEYDLAVKAANKVEGYTLYNLASRYTPGSGEAFLTASLPEVIYTQGREVMSYVHGGTGYVSKTYSSWIDENGNLQYGYIDVAYVMGDSYVVSDELLQLFDANDVRYSAFFARSYQKNYLVSRKYRAAINEAIVETDPITGTPVMPVVEGMDFNEVASIRYAEVVLNKAEAQACAGDAGAVETMRQFLETRYTVVPAIPASGSGLIEFIRRERQKELCFEGHRWFDLRRYAVNSVHKQTIQVKHEWHTRTTSEAVLEGSYTLKAYDNTLKGDWMIPVPEDVINYCFPVLYNFERGNGVVKN